MDPKTGEVGTTDPKAGTHKPGGESLKEDKKVPPQFTAREQIAKRREDERKAEMGGFKVDQQDEDGNITATPEEPAQPLETETKPDAALETAPVETVVTPAAPEEQREIIVNGQRMKVALSKIIEEGTKTLQKESAADMKLAAASELERQLQARLANFEQPPKGVVQDQSRADAQPSDEDAALAKAIQFGTEDEAKKAIASLRGGGNKGMTEAEVLGFVRKVMATELPKQNAFEEANTWIRGEHKEIFSDPDLEAFFMQKETAKRQAGDKSPYRDLYKSIAQEMETKFQLRKAEAVTVLPDEGGLQDRVTRKANAPRTVQGASGKTPAPSAAKQMSVTDYVERQRQMRGLQPINRNNQGI